ncbi:MAG: type IV pilus assembly protein PilQ [Lentisphaeria bacterium]|jgi:type IV pilus assembly protein PilQ
MSSLKSINIRSFALLLCACFFAAKSSALVLQDITFAELPGEKVEMRLQFDSPPATPSGYTIDQPARIVLDFVGAENAVSQKKFTMGIGEASGAVVVSGGGRTRLIINLNNLVPYTTSVSGNELIVSVGSETGSGARSGSVAPTPTYSSSHVSAPAKNSARSTSSVISNIDFRRGESGEGKVIITLSDPAVNIDIEEVSKGIEIKFIDTQLPQELRRTLDVVDFATPVELLAANTQASNALIGITASGDYDYLAYQADNQYVVSVKPLTQRQLEEKKSKFTFVGERLSLTFQDVAVRSVLQVLADFSELNLVASDTVTGNITLRLKNVPWDQSLDIILKAKGLDKRQIGNVLMVAPAAEIAERERQEIETQKQLQELAPLRTEYIRIRYANARELFNLFVDSTGGGGGGGGGGESNSTGSILSDRGQAIVDERTNSIILTDTEEKIIGFKLLVDRIDVPVRQVMIEARIVIANTDFRKELGVRIAGDAVDTSNSGNNKFEVSGRLEGLTSGGGGGPEVLFVDSDGDGITDDERSLLNSNLVDLGVFNPAGAFAWNVISSNFLLGMELSALEDSGFAEIVAQPKVITGDKQQALIQSGTQVAYQEESASGGTTTSFKDAVLKLDVTPQITPDNRVIMTLKITQDSISSITVSGIPTLDITQLNTQVLVEDGATIVLGGIYQTESFSGETKVPLLGDIPFLGRLFKTNIKRENKRELLLFITPRIMASNFVE